MKKIFAFSLCLVLIFSLSVCSFGASPTSSVTVSNFPQYFTGQWDMSILNDLDGIKADLQAYLPNISTWSEQINTNLSSFLDLVVQYYPIFSTNLVNLNTKLNALNTFIQQDFFDLVDFRTTDIINAIGGTTSAVINVGREVSSFDMDFMHATDINNKGSLGYSLYMLQQVLADEDDLAFKQKNKNNEKAVINFAETGTANGNISYISSISSSISSFGFLSDMISIDYGLAETFEYIQDNLSSNEPWMWFTESNKNNINGSSVSSFSSRGDDTNQIEIVTNYLGENKRNLSEFLQERGH